MRPSAEESVVVTVAAASAVGAAAVSDREVDEGREGREAKEGKEQGAEDSQGKFSRQADISLFVSLVETCRGQASQKVSTSIDNYAALLRSQLLAGKHN